VPEEAKSAYEHLDKEPEQFMTLLFDWRDDAL
jgi:hypothetical protein